MAILRFIYESNQQLLDFSSGIFSEDFETFISQDMDGDCMNYSKILEHNEIDSMGVNIIINKNHNFENYSQLIKMLSMYIRDEHNFNIIRDNLKIMKNDVSPYINIVNIIDSDVCYYCIINIGKYSQKLKIKYELNVLYFKFKLP